jgi:WD40 repeat protein
VSATRAGFYVTGGTLAGSAPSYVVRAADEALYGSLSATEYCYVLSSRQMGKSSLMIRTMERLRSDGVTVAAADLSKLGFNLNVDQWYNGLLEQLGGRLNVRAEARDFAAKHAHLGPLQRWMGMMREVLLTQTTGQIVIFIDEIDIVRKLPFPMDEFFAAIRACYNARAEDNAYQQLTFCLLGVATPSDLIADARLTPFNIGQRIHLEDFTPPEATLLQTELGRDPETNRRVMARILYWTGGHPCLTQRLCKAVVESTSARTAAGVDTCCARLFLIPRGELTEDHLVFVSERLMGSTEDETTEQLVLYDRVLAGKSVRDDETRPLVARLKLSGVVKAERERLIVRNRIYAHVFNRTWVRNHLPGAELQRQRAAFRRGVLRTAAVSAAVLIVMASLAITAIRQANLANHYAQLARGESARNRDLATHANDLATNARRQANRADQNAQKARFESAKNRDLAGKADRQARRAERYEKLAYSETARTQDLLYASDMSLMQVAYERNDFRHLRSLLEETRSNPNRGFEWFYWQRKLDSGVTLLNVHTHMGTMSMLSPFGPQIITMGQDNVVRMWDLTTGRELLTLRHPGNIYWVGMSVDGRVIITSSGTGIRLWDVSNGHCLNTIMGTGKIELCTDTSRDVPRIETVGTHIIRINIAGLRGQWLVDRRVCNNDSTSLDVMADGQWKLIKTSKNTLRVWNNKANRSSGAVDHGDTLYAAAFSPDGSQIVTCGRDHTAKIWDTETQRLLLTLQGHRDAVRMAAYSPDGRHVVTVGDDRLGIVWDVLTGEQLATLKGHDDRIEWVCYTPDGRSILTADRAGRVKLWSETELSGLSDAVAQQHGLNAAVFSHSGQRLLTCSDDGTAKVWNAGSRQALYSLVGHRGAVNTASYSRDDRKILTAGDDGTVRIWNAANGAPLLTLTEPGSKVFGAAFSPQGDRIALGTDAHIVKIRDATTGKVLFTLHGHTDRISSVAFSPDGRLLATASADRTVRLWDAATGKPIRTLIGHMDKVYTVAFSPDGRRLVTGSRDRTARIWDVRSGRAVLTIEGQDASVLSAEFSPDGRRILIGGGSTATLWDASSGRQMLVLNGHRKGISSVAFSPDGRQIVTADAGGTARIWSAERAPSPARHWATASSLLYAAAMKQMKTAYARNDFGEMRTLLVETRSNPHRGADWFQWQSKLHQDVLTLRGYPGPVYGAMFFSADGHRFITYGEDRFVRIWNVPTGWQIAALPHPGPISWASISPDGSMIASGDSHGVTLCDIATGHCLAKNVITSALEFCTAQPPAWQDGPRPPGPLSHSYLDKLHGNTLITRYYVSKEKGTENITFTVGPDGHRAVGVTPEGQACLWETETQKQLTTLVGHTGPINSVRFSADSSLIVTCSQDRTAKLWDAATGRLLRTLVGHQGAVRMAAFSPDGRRIVTVGEDQIGIVWDVATGQQLATLRGHEDAVNWVCYSPDARWIATGSAVGAVKIWRAIEQTIKQKQK